MQNPFSSFLHVLTSIGMSTFLVFFIFGLGGLSSRGCFSPLAIICGVCGFVTIVACVSQWVVSRQRRKGNKLCAQYMGRLYMQMMVMSSVLTVASFAVLMWGVLAGWLLAPGASLFGALLLAAVGMVLVVALVWYNAGKLFRRLSEDVKPNLINTLSLSACGLVALALSIVIEGEWWPAVALWAVWLMLYVLYVARDRRDRCPSRSSGDSDE